MATTHPFSKEQIARYEEEFQRANKRVQTRYVAGAVLIFLSMIGLLTYALYSFQRGAG